MIFGVASSSANYMDAAISRISARSDLPRRRPRRMKITQIGSGSGVNGSAGITSPLLPLPGVLAAQDASKAAAPPEHPTGSSRAVSGAKAYPKAVMNQAQPKPPSPRLQASSALSATAKPSNARPAGPAKQSETMAQCEPPSSSLSANATASNAPTSNGVPINALLVRSKQPARPCARVDEKVGKQQVSSSKLATAPLAASQSPTETGVMLAELNTNEDLETDNTHIDRRRLAGVHRVAGDLAMPQARLLGERRARPVTPASGYKPALKNARPSK